MSDDKGKTVEINLENIQEGNVSVDDETVKMNAKEDTEDATASNIGKEMNIQQNANVFEDCQSKKKYNFAKSREKQERPKDKYPFQYKKTQRQQINPLPYGQKISVFLTMTKEPAGEVFSYKEEEPEDRNAFVRKTFIITAIMLAFTAFYVCLSIFVFRVKLFMVSLIGMCLLAICMLGHFAIGYIWCCIPAASNKPWCYILCVAECLCYSYIAGFIAARVAPYIVFVAALTTLSIALLCLGLAFLPIDFTRWYLVVIVASWALGFVAIILAVVMYAMGIKLSIVRLVISVVGAVVTSMALIIQFQMIIGGKRLEIGVDDFCYAAWSVYTSIISLFIHLIRIIAFAGGE